MERSRLMYSPVFRAQIVAVALATFTATPAMTQTVVEKRLAAARRAPRNKRLGITRAR